MAGTGTTVKVGFIGEDSSLSRTLRKVRGETDKTAKSTSGLASTQLSLKNALAAVGGAVVVRGLMSSISAASDLNETMWKSFAVFGKSAGLSGDQLVGFSEQMVQLASDMASFSNTSPEEAITAIGAAMRGEMEPIRKYGVLLDDATLRQEALALGLIKTTKQALTPQQKVLASQSAILKQTGAAQGDFARTSDGLANSQRIMTAELNNASAQLGQVFLPAMTAVVHVGAAALSVFTALPGPVRNAALAFTAVAVASKLLGPSVGTARAALSNLILDVRTAPAKMGAFKAGLSGITGILGGPWGLALTAGITAVTYFASAHKAASKEVRGLTDSLTFQNGVLDENSRKTLATTLAQKGLFDITTKIGRSEKDVTDAIVSGGSARDALLKSLDAQALAGRTVMTGARSATVVYSEQGQSALNAAAIIREYGGSVDQSAKSAKQATAAIDGTTKATDKNSTSTEKAKGKYEKFTSAVTDAKTALDDYMGIARDSEGVHRAAEAAVDDLAQSFRDNGKSLDITTAKGRANRESIERLVDAANDEVAVNKARGESGKKIREDYDKRIDRIYKEAAAHGVSKGKVKAYLEQLRLIPKKKVTTVVTPGLRQAKAWAHALRTDLNAIAGHSVSEHSTPGRARGGPVSAGQPYIVGEHRPELFVPSRSGTILPSTNGVGGGGMNIVIDNRGAVMGRGAADEIVRYVKDYVRTRGGNVAVLAGSRA